MDAAPEIKMEQITTEMAEYFCDKICKHPMECQNEEELKEICFECKMGKFICDILNEYNRK